MTLKNKNIYFSILSVIILCMVTLSDLKAQAPAGDKVEAKAFVQKFYDWYTVWVEKYLTEDHKKNPGPPDVIAMQQKPECFDGALRKALVEDAIAESKAHDAGLDYDPFLAAQDDVPACHTGEVKLVGNKFLVDVYYGREDKLKKNTLNSEVAITAEVAKIDANWKFTNFIYRPFNGVRHNLLDELKHLRQSREKTVKR